MKNNIDIKKIVIIIIIIGFLIGSYFLISNLFGNRNSSSVNELSTFLPFEEETTGTDNKENPITINNPYGISTPTKGNIPLLRKISNIPVAGGYIFQPEADQQKDVENYSLIRFIERGTGHIYETSTNSLTQVRVSNTTIPKIQETVWLDKDSLIIRYLDDNDIIKTFSANLITNDLGDQELEGFFLQNDIREIIKFGKKIFYLLDSGKGTIGVISDKNDENKKIIFENPLKEWLLKNINDKHISLTTKPAINIDGFLFLFNTETQILDKVIGGKPNLSTLMNKSFDTLYSEYGKLGPKLSIYNNQEGVSTDIFIKTFPEKCVWDKNEPIIYCGVPTEELTNYDLTKWYQGTTSFTDSIWKINIETGKTEFLISPSDFDIEDIDIINPILSEKGDYLLFMNKKDFNLWLLKLSKY